MSTNTKVLTPIGFKMSPTKELTTYSNQKQIRHKTASAEQVDHAESIIAIYYPYPQLINEKRYSILNQ